MNIKQYIPLHKNHDDFCNTVEELQNITKFIKDNKLDVVLMEGYNLKLYDIVNCLDDLNINIDEFAWYCERAYDDFIEYLKINHKIDFDSCVEYVGRSSTFHFKISNEWLYDYNDIFTAIENAYLYDEHIDNIIDSINNALVILDYINYYKSVETFKNYVLGY